MIPLYRYDLELLRKALQLLLPHYTVPVGPEPNTPYGDARRLGLIQWLTDQIVRYDSPTYQQKMIEFRARYWKEKQNYD